MVGIWNEGGGQERVGKVIRLNKELQRGNQLLREKDH